ncbi:hypothetical protein IGI04_024580, partial [Brassica rapa subsp. trilocularis]
MSPHGDTNVMISLFAWNTRGFNKMRKQTALRSWIQSAKPSFGCLIETRVREENSTSILNSALPNWNFLTNYDHHRLGKIWVCWAGDVSQKIVLQDPNETTFEEAADAMTYWNHWAAIEENFLRQKSRIIWLQHGDQNTLFFFKIVQSRTSFNMIRRLTLPSGEIITDLHHIKLMAAAHFESFLQQSPVHVTAGTAPN